MAAILDRARGRTACGRSRSTPQRQMSRGTVRTTHEEQRTSSLAGNATKFGNEPGREGTTTKKHGAVGNARTARRRTDGAGTRATQQPRQGKRGHAPLHRRRGGAADHDRVEPGRLHPGEHHAAPVRAELGRIPDVELHSWSATGYVVRTAVAPSSTPSGCQNYTYKLVSFTNLGGPRDYGITVSGEDSTQWTRTAILTENDSTRKGWEIHNKRETHTKGSTAAFAEASADESMLLAINGYVYNPGRTPPSCYPAQQDQIWCADVTAGTDGIKTGLSADPVYGSIYGKTTFTHGADTWRVGELISVSGGLGISLINDSSENHVLNDGDSFRLKVNHQEISFADGTRATLRSTSRPHPTPQSRPLPRPHPSQVQPCTSCIASTQWFRRPGAASPSTTTRRQR